MSDKDGLICAYVLDGEGGAKASDWQGVTDWTVADGPLWVYFDKAGAGTEDWLRKHSGLRNLQIDALLAEETQPRLAFIDNGVLLTLRGVNLNPGADPEDMVSLRIWVDAERIFTVRIRPLMAVKDVRERFDAGHGPRDTSEMLSMLATCLVRRMNPVIDRMNEEIDNLEEAVVNNDTQDLRHRLRELRRQAIELRRYLAPQQAAVEQLYIEHIDWIDPEHRLAFRECADQVSRVVQDLDAMRERAAIIRDELAERLSEKLNRNLYLLSVVAALMLPLGVITSMFGMNVGGVPFAENKDGFLVVSVLLGLVVALQVLIFRLLKWI